MGFSPALFTFPPFSTRSCITISTIEDVIDENDERFSVLLSNPSSAVTVSVGSPNRATVFIVDDDEPTTPPPVGKEKNFSR